MANRKFLLLLCMTVLILILSILEFIAAVQASDVHFNSKWNRGTCDHIGLSNEKTL
jgi:hypothetical protein